MEEDKIQKIKDAIQELDWSDDKVLDILPGFFDNPLDAIEDKMEKCSDSHLKHLWELLDCTEIDNAAMTKEIHDEKVRELANEHEGNYDDDDPDGIGDELADEAIEEAEHLNDSQYEG